MFQLPHLPVSEDLCEKKKKGRKKREKKNHNHSESPFALESPLFIKFNKQAKTNSGEGRERLDLHAACRLKSAMQRGGRPKGAFGPGVPFLTNDDARDLRKRRGMP